MFLKKTLLDVIKTKWDIHGGATAVVHTWGASLSIHPHIHLIVPAGGFDCKTGEWKGLKKHFLSHIDVMKLRFRNLFMKKIKKLVQSEKMKCPSEHAYIMTSQASFLDFFNKPHSKSWHPYAKKTFGSEVEVIKYLGRYTHRIAISNYRILKVEEGRVSFLFKNY